MYFWNVDCSAYTGDRMVFVAYDGFRIRRLIDCILRFRMPSWIEPAVSVSHRIVLR